MNSPTLYLDLLILLASVNPSGFSFSIRSIFARKETETIDLHSLLYLGLPFLLLLPVIPLFKKNLYFISYPPVFYYLLAVMLVPLCIFLEYHINRIYLYFTTGRLHKGMTLHADWKASRYTLPLLMTIFIAAGEEFIFRQCWFYILAKTFSLPVVVIVIITSALYGLNHFHYGMNTVIAKFSSGAIYGILYVAGGYSILLPIMTHVLQNISLILFAGRKDA